MGSFSSSKGSMRFSCRQSRDLVTVATSWEGSPSALTSPGWRQPVHRFSNRCPRAQERVALHFPHPRRSEGGAELVSHPLALGVPVGHKPRSWGRIPKVDRSQAGLVGARFQLSRLGRLTRNSGRRLKRLEQAARALLPRSAPKRQNCSRPEPKTLTICQRNFPARCDRACRRYEK